MRYWNLRSVCQSIVLISMTVTASPAAEKAAPATRPYTYHEFARDVQNFNREIFIEPYKKLGKRDPKWDAKALAYLEEIVQQVSVDAVPRFYRPDDSLALRPHALASGKALIDAGCDDPVVLYCHAANLIDTQKALEGRPLLKKAVEGLRAGKYPPYLRAIAEDRMVNQTRIRTKGRPREKSAPRRGSMRSAASIRTLIAAACSTPAG